MPDCKTVGELMKLLGEFPEDMPVFNGARHVHAQAATAVRGPHEGRKVLHLTFSDAPAEGNFDASYEAKDEKEVEFLRGVMFVLGEMSQCRGHFAPSDVSAKILLALVEKFQVNPQWVRTGEGDKLLIPYEPGSTLIWGTSTEPQRRLKRVELLCRRFDCGRGVWKQIDENRELLEFLLKEAPELMRRAPFIEAWIGDTDIFLECLVELLELEMPEGALPFPRSWPGRCLHADAVEQSIEDWAERIRRLEQNGGE